MIEQIEKVVYQFDVSDTVRARLGSVQDLIVRPVNSSVSDPDALGAAKALHVDAIVTGCVQRDNDRVRVAVEMVDFSNGRIVGGNV